MAAPGSSAGGRFAGAGPRLLRDLRARRQRAGSESGWGSAAAIRPSSRGLPLQLGRCSRGAFPSGFVQTNAPFLLRRRCYREFFERGSPLFPYFAPPSFFFQPSHPTSSYEVQVYCAHADLPRWHRVKMASFLSIPKLAAPWLKSDTQVRRHSRSLFSIATFSCSLYFFYVRDDPWKAKSFKWKINKKLF